ncbi:MAG: NifU family protein [Alphaproteobacteria bacterium]|nr:NifU family protein [Alphaproteobacteria bacterium]MDD9920221.1 NifU family protein [Alphaproteobacteria bacterium]
MTDDNILTVRTEKTPNPNSLKYHLGKLLIPGGSANFPTAETAEGRSPLAQRMFAISGVAGVFIGSDFFTITREEGRTWEELNEGIAPALENFLESGDSVLTGKKAADAPLIEDTDVDPKVVAEIQQLLDEKVRPAVAQDGGDIIYRGFKDGVVYLEMYGACAGCPSSTVTLKQGVESMLRHYCPTVQSVEAV